MTRKLTYEMNTTASIYSTDLFFKDLSTITGGARRWYSCNENLNAICSQSIDDTPPMRNFNRGDGRTDRDSIETQKPMTKYHGIRGCRI